MTIRHTVRTLGRLAQAVCREVERTGDLRAHASNFQAVARRSIASQFYSGFSSERSSNMLHRRTFA
eukprot:jgi/Botrbrau1/6540/Bobra.40_2s0011.1